MIAAVIDNETTDLIKNRTRKLDKQPHIVEFYGRLYDFEKRETIRDLHHFIKPPIPMPKESSKITRITDEMLADKPTFEAVAPAIKEFLESAPLVIAHNASFDQEVIDVEFQRLGQTLKWPKLLCSVEATIHLKGHRLKLHELHQLLFVDDFKDAHRAPVDVAALTRCCAELYQRGEL
jgi:DNA polymerase-3 subunit epsilon